MFIALRRLHSSSAAHRCCSRESPPRDVSCLRKTLLKQETETYSYNKRRSTRGVNSRIALRNNWYVRVERDFFITLLGHARNRNKKFEICFGYSPLATLRPDATTAGLLSNDQYTRQFRVDASPLCYTLDCGGHTAIPINKFSRCVAT